jgi:hypothetical protein
MSEIVGVDGVEVACVVYNRDVAADEWVGVADMVFMIVPPVCCCPENRKK